LSRLNRIAAHRDELILEERNRVSEAQIEEAAEQDAS
jgi:hypothetical protein